LCATPDEDFAHVLRCPHPSHEKWHTDLISNLRKKCHSLSTDQWLIDILIAGIQSYLSHTPFDSTEYPAEYQSLISEQTTIGWVQIFQGRLSTSWQQIQQYHYSGLKPIKGRDGASWSRNIISFIFAEWVLLWEARNKLVHGDDTTTQAQAKHNQAIRALEILYSYRDQVLQRDRSFY
jgi:hypothetical protein